MWSTSIELFICFIATASFGIIFNVPIRLVWMGGFIGVIAWFIYSTLPDFGVTLVFSSGVAAFVAALVSHWMARYQHVPVTTFTIPGIIPLVPGGRAYATMLAFVEEDYMTGLEEGVETLLQAGSIAGGIVFALSVFSIGKGVGQRYETNR